MLRCILDTHTEIKALHELHLRYLTVGVAQPHLRLALEVLGHDETTIRHLLWDRLLHQQLVVSGKRHLVEKSPCNLEIFDDLRACWPAARFLLLLRHPLKIARSMIANFPDYNETAVAVKLSRVDAQVTHVRDSLPNLFCIQYERLVRHPEHVVSEVCRELGVPYEPAMLNYGTHDHGPFRYGLGDWGDRIMSGRVLPEVEETEPIDLNGVLTRVCRRWGYGLRPEEAGAIPSRDRTCCKLHISDIKPVSPGSVA